MQTFCSRMATLTENPNKNSQFKGNEQEQALNGANPRNPAKIPPKFRKNNMQKDKIS